MSDWRKFFEDLLGREAGELGVTPWFTIDQQATDVYAALIADLDPMHNDPDWAGTGTWGGTIVVGTHGLCLLPSLLGRHGFPVEEPGIGFQPVKVSKCRFTGSLLVGHSARDRAELVETARESRSSWQVCTRHTLEREGEEKPFMVATLHSRYTLGGPGA